MPTLKASKITPASITPDTGPARARVKVDCLDAAKALIKFKENFIVAGKSLSVEYHVAEQPIVIDPATAEHIELVSTPGHGKSKLHHNLVKLISQFPALALSVNRQKVYITFAQIDRMVVLKQVLEFLPSSHQVHHLQQ